MRTSRLSFGSGGVILILYGFGLLPSDLYQLSGAMYRSGYRADITTSHTIKFRGIEYDIVRIDPFEGYKTDLKLYCKRKS